MAYLQEDSVAVAFIVAEDNVRVKSFNGPSPQTLVLALLAAYWAWGMSFPFSFTRFLWISEELGLGHKKRDKDLNEQSEDFGELICCGKRSRIIRFSHLNFCTTFIL